MYFSYVILSLTSAEFCDNGSSSASRQISSGHRGRMHLMSVKWTNSGVFKCIHSRTCGRVDASRVLLPCVIIWYDKRTLFATAGALPSPFRYFIIVRKMSRRSNIPPSTPALPGGERRKLLWKTCLTDWSEFAWLLAEYFNATAETRPKVLAWAAQCRREIFQNQFVYRHDIFLIQRCFIRVSLANRSENAITIGVKLIKRKIRFRQRREKVR